MLVHLSSDASASAQILRSSPWNPHPQILILGYSVSYPQPHTLSLRSSSPQLLSLPEILILRSSSSHPQASDPHIPSLPQILVLRSPASAPQILRDPHILVLRSLRSLTSLDPHTFTSSHPRIPQHQIVTSSAPWVCVTHWKALPDSPGTHCDFTSCPSCTPCHDGMLCCLAVCVSGCLPVFLSVCLTACLSVYRCVRMSARLSVRTSHGVNKIAWNIITTP